MCGEQRKAKGRLGSLKGENCVGNSARQQGITGSV